MCNARAYIDEHFHYQTFIVMFDILHMSKVYVVQFADILHSTNPGQFKT